MLKNNNIVFFMLLLFLGYLYTNLLTKLRPQLQAAIHLTLIAGSIATLVSLNILPGQASAGAWVSSPSVIRIILILSASIGLPYFLLSTTSVLLQFWYARTTPGKSPYRFYVISNLGSLLALLSYPVLVEPVLTLKIQGLAWAAVFFVFAAGLVLSLFWFAAKSKSQETEASDRLALSYKAYGLWIGLSGLSSLMLLAITNEITKGIAPVPFLWLVPLSLYLLTYIICFSDTGIYNRPIFCIMLLVTSLVLLAGKTLGFTFIYELALYNLVLFAVCMICHGELYAARPQASRLTSFYTLISLGGVIGGIFVALVAPFIFNDYWEFILGLLASVILCLVFLSRSFDRWFSRRQLVALGVAMLVQFITLGAMIFGQQSSAVASSRNFYGALRVDKRDDKTNGSVHSLVNGKIVHGTQFLSEEKKRWPTTYYSRGSGVGLAIANHPKRVAAEPLRVGGIGLGAGTIAAYCEPKDYFQFYEINSDVVKIAKENFSYLADCPGEVAITLGDARLEMQKELEANKPGKYDILAVDAFVDDAIPVHLLTTEAMGLYLSHLGGKDSILAIHVSNRYLDLVPVLAGHAQHYNLYGTLVVSAENSEGAYSSSWVLLSRQPLPTRGKDILVNEKKIRMWTDDFSNLFQVLK